MRNTLLFALLGAVYIAVEGQFSYEDSSYEQDFSPVYYPRPESRQGYSYSPRTYYPSYYRSLPRTEYVPVWDYSQTADAYALQADTRSGRSKKKYGGGWKGGWWYKKTPHGIVSGRWGSPPPPGLEKEHYIYGGHGGGQGNGWGWGGSGYGGGHGHGGGHHGGHHGGHGGGHHFGGHGGGHHGGHHGGHGGWGWGGNSGGGGGYARGWGWPKFEHAKSHWHGSGWESLSLGGKGWGWK